VSLPARPTYQYRIVVVIMSMCSVPSASIRPGLEMT
jgi:hypothetical protein